MSRTAIAMVVLSLALFASAASANTITGDPLAADPSKPWNDGGPLSSNADNYALVNSRPYVLLFDDNTPGEITLEFVNKGPGLAFFEYRIDGVQTGASAHPVVMNDTIHSGIGISQGGANRVETFFANSTVDIRLALGGEEDYRFNWTRFDVAPAPLPASACGGIALFGLISAKRRRKNTQVA